MKFNSFSKAPNDRFEPINWAPHWEIVLTYDEPDGSTEGEFPRHYFLNRHVRPDVSHDWSPRVTRDTLGMDEVSTGCHVSAAALPPTQKGEGKRYFHSHIWEDEELKGGSLFQNDDSKTAHQRDWDKLTEAVADAFGRHGVSKSSTNIEKIRCLVELQNEHYGKVYPSRNPVDVLLYSHYCTGASNLLAGLCMVAGIPARTINNAVHSMTEVWDGKKWIFSDNIGIDRGNEWRKDQPGKQVVDLYEHLNYSQLLLNPSSPSGDPLHSEMVERFRIRQPAFEPYLNTGTADWHFNHGSIGMDRPLTPTDYGAGLFALPCPDNVKAVYPEWDSPHFFSIPGRENELILNPRQGWFQSPLRIDRGMGIKKSFYLGQLEGAENPVKTARCDLHLAEGVGSEFVPERGGWGFYVNETQVPLDRSNYRLFSGLLTIEIPVSLLKEDSMNTVSLLSEKKYPISTRYRMPDMLPIWSYPDVLGIEEPWYGDENYTDYTYPDAPRSGNGAIINQHSGWLFVSEGS
jgi:hypothetical protein